MTAKPRSRYKKQSANAEDMADRPKLASCTPDDVFRTIDKLGGFRTQFQSAKHTKFVHIGTGHAATIPRHSPINRHLLKDFVEDFLVTKCGFTEDEVYEHLWC